VGVENWDRLKQEYDAESKGLVLSQTSVAAGVIAGSSAAAGVLAAGLAALWVAWARWRLRQECEGKRTWVAWVMMIMKSSSSSMVVTVIAGIRGVEDIENGDRESGENESKMMRLSKGVQARRNKTRCWRTLTANSNMLWHLKSCIDFSSVRKEGVEERWSSGE
jgi:hypothetical protein